jgi:hypothetical protein
MTKAPPDPKVKWGLVLPSALFSLYAPLLENHCGSEARTGFEPVTFDCFKPTSYHRSISPCLARGGNWIRTSDLQLMRLMSYRTALSR